MPINKEFITRLIIALAFILVLLRVIIPLIWDKFKGKTLGLNDRSDDLDYLIKKEKENIKSQYRSTIQSNLSSEGGDLLKSIKSELTWGQSKTVEQIKNRIYRDFSYKFSDSKINSFFQYAESKRLLNFIDTKTDYTQLENFLIALFILLVLIDENKNNDISFSKHVAKKLNLSPSTLLLSVQIKILMTSTFSTIKEDRIFSDKLVLSQYSEETIFSGIQNIIKDEHHLWKKSLSTLFEELSLQIKYAKMLEPLPIIKNKKDIEGAYNVFGVNLNDFETMKKEYKKMALLFHPDKLDGLKLPLILKKKCQQKFGQYKEAYDVINEGNKNGHT